MKKEYMTGIHFVIFVILSIIFAWLIKSYVVEDALLLIAWGSYVIIAGMWGNIAKITLLNVPSSPKSYRIVNYILIVLGCVALIAGLYNHFLK